MDAFSEVTRSLVVFYELQRIEGVRGQHRLNEVIHFELNLGTQAPLVKFNFN